MTQNVVALIFGGRSAEHAVSLMSARSLYEALTSSGYPTHCVGIDNAGVWHYQGQPHEFPDEVDTAAPVLTLQPGRPVLIYSDAGSVLREIAIDLMFPALHGLYGEDGAIQGLGAMCGIPCVGSGILGSAVAIDKDMTKRLVSAAGIKVAPWVAGYEMLPWGYLVESLGGEVLYVKPATCGSSIGVARVTCEAEYLEAYAIAQRLDPKVIVEKEIKGREIECGILESDGRTLASPPGEILPASGCDFYNYDAKYAAHQSSTLLVPSPVSATLSARIQTLSLEVFRCLGLQGLARIDFFLLDDEIILNEVNTLPGFTGASMYPKVFEVAGLSIARIADELVKTVVGRSAES